MRNPALIASLLLVVVATAGLSEEKEKQLSVTTARAFPNLKFNRPIVVTGAGDGTDRLFVAEQTGKIKVLPNDQDATEAAVFIDLEDQVVYKDQQNEEGLLGLAFHPKYKDNGEFFVYYTTTEEPQLSVISRFRRSKDDANQADADFEEEIMRIKQPFWNHNGGTILFGPNGYLYVALGDGGKANDPLLAGQDKSKLLGSILRIDVDNKDKGLNYAIPKDNPFVDEEGSRGEIWAYGFRNPWRISFDRKTGDLWCGDVGQNLWEEIDIVVKGGNYGWNRREGKHPFGDQGVEANDRMIDPVWEYNHKVGKSITGGNVYRGKQCPALVGKYIYADYVISNLWALDYDVDAAKLNANYKLGGAEDKAIITFGEDDNGELYFTDTFGRIFWFVQTNQ